MFTGKIGLDITVDQMQHNDLMMDLPQKREPSSNPCHPTTKNVVLELLFFSFVDHVGTSFDVRITLLPMFGKQLIRPH